MKEKCWTLYQIVSKRKKIITAVMKCIKVIKKWNETVETWNMKHGYKWLVKGTKLNGNFTTIF